jgi:anthranilate phosphoribosyltransferase
MHPRALGRILSSISFGTVLNLAASLANPALPAVAVRGVNHRNLLLPTVKTMREIGYSRALVVHGEVPDCSDGGIDEASTMGATFICELKHDGSISEYSISTQQMGISPAHPAELLMGTSRYTEAQRMKNLLTGHESRARTDIACLNAGLILYVADRVPSISTGYQRAMELIQTKRPINKLIDWVNVQR